MFFLERKTEKHSFTRSISSSSSKRHSSKDDEEEGGYISKFKKNQQFLCIGIEPGNPLQIRRSTSPYTL